MHICWYFGLLLTLWCFFLTVFSYYRCRPANEARLSRPPPCYRTPQSGQLWCNRWRQNLPSTKSVEELAERRNELSAKEKVCFNAIFVLCFNVKKSLSPVSLQVFYPVLLQKVIFFSLGFSLVVVVYVEYVLVWRAVVQMCAWRLTRIVHV